MRLPFLRGRFRHASLLICLGLASPQARAASSQKTGVLLPLRGAASQRALEFQHQRQEARQHWPRFLTDTRRNPSLRAHGLLTRPAARAARAAAKASGTAPTDTARVLLVRLGFATNRQPNLTSMDASGDFRLQPDSTAIVDPPPHDGHYFEAMLVGLRSYYEVMSHGALTVQGTVFPAENDSSLKLSDPADYGPGSGGQWTLELLEKYFRDAVKKLGTDAALHGLDLSNWDSFVFVHPGSDLQNDINRDSPNDLPSFFMTLADSVVVQDSIEVRNGIIIPETLNQDGLLGGVLGGLCHEFGHQLGLPDWYDTFFGLPVVGEWDLMDSGNAALFAFQREGNDEVIVAYGLLPTGLSAIDRVLLGWEDPYVLRAPEDQVVLRPSSSSLGSGPRTARLDVSADEYFLVENRRDVLYKTAADSADCPYLNRDRDTGVVLWMSRDNTTKPSRQRRNSGEYDFFIAAPSAPPDAFEGPCQELGFGLLVWHVDERIFADGYATNEVNIDERQRALRILEASGDFEIGDWRAPTASFVGDGYNDPYREGYATQLGVDTTPNNWNNDWARTGWEITDVQFVAPESHRLSIRVLDPVADWTLTARTPQETDSLGTLEPKGVLLADIAGAGRVVVMADSNGVYAFGPAGQHVLHRGPVKPASLAYIAKLDPNDTAGTLAALDSERVWLWEARLVGDSLPVRAGFPDTLRAGTGERIVLFPGNDTHTGVLAETAGGSWVGYTPTGARTLGVTAGARAADPVVGPLDAEAGLDLALATRTHVHLFPGVDTRPASSPRAPQELMIAHGLDAPDSLLLTAGAKLDRSSSTGQVVLLRRDGALRVVDPVRGVLSGFQDLPRDHYIGLAIGDVNGDGELDIVAASPTRICGETSRGARILNTPIVLQDVFALQNAVHVSGGPLLADVAGDSLPEILVTTDLGLLYVLDAAGRPVEGYPRKILPDRFPATLLVGDLDGDASQSEILAVSGVTTNAVSPSGGTASASWSARRGGATRTGFASSTPAVHVASRLRALERPLYAYPNPSSDGLVQLRITAQRTGAYDVRIYNLEGQQVFAANGSLQPGTTEIPWRCSSCASGVYLCRFVSPAAGVTSPMIEPITVRR